jgi:hypothetical protein
MNLKQKSNHQQYIRVFGNMSAAQLLNKAFELSLQVKQLFMHGLKKRFPDKSETEIKQIYLQRLEKCYNRH